jgi:carboxypeptidase PM20D1
MLWIFIVLSVIIILIVVFLMRTVAFRPPVEKACVIESVAVNAEETAAHLARMIRCKTVSSLDGLNVNKNEFEKFRNLLAELYPRMHKVCKVERIGVSGILYTFKGRNEAAPIVLMAHYDVVPAEDRAWDKPPFEGIIEDGVLWGRGTLDTKGTLCAICEAVEGLVAGGFVPENDLYFAFSGDEEIAGESAPLIVDEFQKRGVAPAMVLDEGGAVVEGVFPGVSLPCAMVGTAEKGILDVELSVEGRGGHASTPPPHTPVGVLARAVTRIENRPFKSRLTPPVAVMFDTLGRHSPFLYRLVFANLWCFKPLLELMCRKLGGELNAMMRTTCAFTMMEGSGASNVIPPVAKVTANLRILGGETVENAIAYLKSIADDPDIKFRAIYGMDPSPNSLTGGNSWEMLKNAVSQTWPGALVSPYMMFACTDSRHYHRIGDHVYRFSAMALSREERATIHGHNERIPLDTLVKLVQFYTRLIRHC